MKSKSQRVSIWCVPLSHLSPPWFSLALSSPVRWSFSVGCSSTLPAMLFAIARECWECSDVFLRACPVRTINAQLGTNLDWTVAGRVVQCCCLPESFGKLWLHEDGHYNAGKSFDAVVLAELRQDEGSHLCILPLLGSREQQSMATSPHAKSLPIP